MATVKVCNGAGIVGENGVGIFAGAIRKRFPQLPVEEDGGLHDPVFREMLIERALIYRRLSDYQSSTLNDFLIDNGTVLPIGLGRK